MESRTNLRHTGKGALVSGDFSHTELDTKVMGYIRCARTAQRNLAELARGLARRSSNEARIGSGATRA